LEAVSWQHGYDMTTPPFINIVFICDDRYDLVALKRPTIAKIRVIDFTSTSFMFQNATTNMYVQ